MTRLAQQLNVTIEKWKTPENTTDVYLNESQAANSANDARVLRTLASTTKCRIGEEVHTKKGKNTVYL